jgi:hypothetical protein
MVKALALVEAGATGYRAGREAGISPQALYQNRAYKRLISERRARGEKVRAAFPRRRY